MKRSFWFQAFACVFVCIAACSSEDKPPITGEGFDTAAAAQTLATAQCTYSERCEPAVMMSNQTDKNGCIAEVQANLKESFDFLNPTVAAGRAAFYQSKLDACVAELAAADCDLGITDASPCNDLIVGVQATNAPCTLSIECAPDNYCARGGLGQCGSCKPAAARGAPCPEGACVRGSICIDVSSGGDPDFRCIPNDAPENSECLTVETGICRGRLQCVGAQAPYTCKRPAPMNAPCDHAMSSNPDCDIYANAICDEGTCKPATWANVGASCGGTVQCAGEAYCPASGGQCTALPGPGASCMSTDGECSSNAYCNESGTCAALKGSGSACAFSDECSGDLSCVGPDGAGTCMTYDWSQCG